MWFIHNKFASINMFLVLKYVEFFVRHVEFYIVSLKREVKILKLDNVTK